MTLEARRRTGGSADAPGWRPSNEGRRVLPASGGLPAVSQ